MTWISGKIAGIPALVYQLNSSWYTRLMSPAHSHCRIAKMVVLRHELAEYWKKYRRVLLVDATHGISITGFKLFTVVVVDSLHKSVLVAYAFIRSESFINLNFVAEALGINAERITVISDDSETEDGVNGRHRGSGT